MQIHLYTNADMHIYVFMCNACISSLANLIGLSRLIIQSLSDCRAAVRSSGDSLPQDTPTASWAVASFVADAPLSMPAPSWAAEQLPCPIHSSSQPAAICCNVACQLSSCSVSFQSFSAYIVINVGDISAVWFFFYANWQFFDVQSCRGNLTFRIGQKLI